ncbi:MAG: ABC transporter substrate-binding protein [Rikenellaceae bacterium]|nr:ABC transporter substrate-binding protein [Rikenellaceae bacterium]
MNRFFIIFFCTISLFSGCRITGEKFSTDNLELLYSTVYASGFEIYEHGNSSVLKIKNLWDSGEEDSIYFLSRNGEEPPESFQGTTISVPVTNAVCMSSTNISFLEMLGCGDIITGVSGGDFISSPVIKERIKNRIIRDIGYEGSADLELLVDISPDIIMTYGITGESSILGPKTEELGLKTLYIGDYLEMSPLGRAEWLMVYAELTDKRELALKEFNRIVQEYTEVCRLISDSAHRPSVMLNAPWRDTWFVPGDRNYMVRLLTDAGGEYVCKGTDSESSRPISIENAYLYASGADFWLNPGSASSLAELVADNPNFSDIRSVQSGNIYNNNKRSTPEGGSDFWESGAVMPEMILKDLIRILHPELLPEHDLYFFIKLH